MKKSFKSLQSKSREELLKELKLTQENIFKLRFKKSVEETMDTSQFRKSRVKIAQINTLLRQMELAATQEKKA